MPQWPYVLPPQLVRFIDRRVLDQIMSDTDDNVNTLVEFANPASAVYLDATEGLEAASAEVDGAVTEAGRYDVADLVWLADEPVQVAGEMPRPDHGALLRRLVGGLWLRARQDRRVRPGPEFEAMRRLGDWAQAFLERVRVGQGLLPARGSMGLLPADLAAAREAALGRIAGNVGAGQPDKGTFDTTTADLYPRRMFARTDRIPGRLDTGYTDGGFTGPCR